MPAETPELPAILKATIAENLARVQARIRAACLAAGRRAEDVTLVAVSKTQGVDAVRAALAAGQLHFGENRVQEAADKFSTLKETHPQLRLHLIGGLQTNKARLAVRLGDVIESLDRPKLADALADAMAREGRTPRLLVEVNVGDEPQKSGVPRADADRFIASCQERFGAALVGLMCVPPAAGDPAPHFAWLAACAARHRLAVLSMGMSADYETAIAHGATHVRVGTAIFGARAGALPQTLPLER
ncbi:MAG TPA: YggS family pyridoxal phosphate-dependent enzyme [Acetobacteraceae bacterium]|nr:YggS family pyridoxal phosphate-dependent enzyme [Acetobacteraceae bacterium]